VALPAIAFTREHNAAGVDLCELSIAEARLLLLRRAISAVELLQAHILRIDRVEPLVEAWATLDVERAMASAQQADIQLMERSGQLLAGIPLGIKDVIDVAGVPTTANFKPFADSIVQSDASVVAGLRRAGAIVLGKTVTVQFAHGHDATPTRNPWDSGRSPGGSSSGSAAAVAARMVPAALGTQTGGSTLRPAAYCGVVGLKPTIGLVSCAGIWPSSWSLDHPGVIARSVEDAATMLVAISGNAESRLDPPRPESRRGVSADASDCAPRLGLLRDLLDLADPEVRANCQAVAQVFEAAGARVCEVRLPVPLDLLLATHKVVCWVEAAAVHQDLLRRFPDDYAPNLRATLEVSQLLPGVVYLRARQLLQRFRFEASGLFTTCDALLAPTVGQLAPAFGSTGDASFQSAISLIGLPNISLPSGLSADGLPLAVQLVAPHYGDAQLLRAAAWCESRMPQLPGPPLSRRPLPAG
jgi:aspartyl-tRNA(Asn)/glutamyl-tRNA(Gln) amidotransferase subunit A